MRRERATLRTLRRRLLARVSALALRVALRPRGWAPGLLAVGLIGASAPALAQQTIDLATDADVTIQGAAANELSGFSVSGAGDVNGDGIDDLIIGAPFANGFAGASYVVFGSDQGFPATIDLATDADVTIQGAGFSGGYVSEAGDVNGDGIDDLLIGYSLPPGASYVVFGSDQGFPATIDLATGADLTLQGGKAVSDAGDVNGDGIDDLIIGAEGAGASYVVFGSDQGFPATIDLATGADLIIQGATAYDLSGESVSGAGDVNGDGIDDIIIGAPHANPNGRDTAGASYVVFGSAQGFPATIDLATEADLTIQGAAVNDNSGTAVSGAGDVNGDGIDDLIIGASYADPNGRFAAGASFVVFGSDQGFPATIDLATDADLIIQGATEYDSAGFSVSGAGDVDGDGIDDLIIGAPGAGASYVVFGSDQGFPATIDLATDADLVMTGDNAGFSVGGAGDVNGDGIDDLIIGAPFADDGAGASYVVFGTPAALDPAAAIEDLITDVEAADLQPGIEKILTRTLDKALDSLSEGKERRAIIALRLFIIEVEVFRGKKIPEALADAWIADAEAIIETLKAQKDRHRGPRHHAPSPMVEAQQ
jgi:glycosylphosphatidylinositol phospholipase D